MIYKEWEISEDYMHKNMLFWTLRSIKGDINRNKECVKIPFWRSGMAMKLYSESISSTSRDEAAVILSN